MDATAHPFSPATTIESHVKLALAFTEADRLIRFADAIAGDRSQAWSELIGDAAIPAAVRKRVTSLHYGNEFCERLIPKRAALESAIRASEGAALELWLVTPTLTDRGVDSIGELVAMLPEGSGVVANDWGLIHHLRGSHPRLRIAAGRLLCKMLKEPRIASPQHMELGGHGFMSPGLEALISRLGVEVIEIDAPPFASVEDLHAPGVSVALHLPFGFATTGRICRIGSLHQEPAAKFASGHNCAHECLTYLAAIKSARPDAMRLFQRGNTIFYRHTTEMAKAVEDACALGVVHKLIVSGDWNETGSPDRCG